MLFLCFNNYTLGIEPGFKKGTADLKGAGRDMHRKGAQRKLMSDSGDLSIPFRLMSKCFILYVHTLSFSMYITIITSYFNLLDDLSKTC